MASRKTKNLLNAPFARIFVTQDSLGPNKARESLEIAEDEARTDAIDSLFGETWIYVYKLVSRVPVSKIAEIPTHEPAQRLRFTKGHAKKRASKPNKKKVTR